MTEIFLKKIVIILIFCGCCLTSTAQNKNYAVSGEVKDSSGQTLMGAGVTIAELKKTTIVNADGSFLFRDVKEGIYTFLVSHVGYTSNKRIIEVAKDVTGVAFMLEADALSLKTVAVYGYSATQLANRQAYNVKAIDAKQLHNSTADVAAVLDRVSGVRLRQTGGVGSDFNLSINGFSGNRIRFFLDGVAMENFGPAFQINNIPINLAERVEVYKGVVPVWLGSDALGGAVNIVTGQGMRNFIDASYSFGSFNTHRSYVNTGITSKNGFTAKLSLFQNYSDNDYKVKVDVADIRTGAYTRNASVRRFHDTYHNETAIAQLGVVDRKWADQLLFGITLGQYYKEIQSGARLVAVFGALHTRGNIVTPNFKFQKKNAWIKGLDVALNANYNLGREQLIDTVPARFGWRGDSIRFSGTGGERNYSHYQYKNNAANASATISYALAGGHQLSLNTVYTHFDRQGSDVLFPNQRQYQLPQKMGKNVSGLSYQYASSEKWSATVFGKLIHQNAYTTLMSNAISDPLDTLYNDATVNRSKIGYGLATSYLFRKGLQMKFSYEKTNRLPEPDDIYGDFISKLGNWNIKPESSDNVNLGLNYRFGIGESHFFDLSTTGIYSRAKDYIYYTFDRSQLYITPQNLEGVSNLGLESEFRYSYGKRLTAGLNMTYQNIRNQQKYLPGSQIKNEMYNNRIPNIPYLFGNADASLFFKDLAKKDDRLSIGYNLQYIHEFFLFWQGAKRVDSEFLVPTQLAHDINVIYATSGGRYNVALECKNLSNVILYDNFSLQKPGRAFYLKLRYFIGQ